MNKQQASLALATLILYHNAKLSDGNRHCIYCGEQQVISSIDVHGAGCFITRAKQLLKTHYSRSNNDE